MLYGYDLLDGFSSVEELCWDDAFAKSVVGSQGNKEDLEQGRPGPKEDPERFASAMRSGNEGKEWQNHL
jgi:hypothetical protein